MPSCLLGVKLEIESNGIEEAEECEPRFWEGHVYGRGGQQCAGETLSH